jgi:hypothetical protein
MEDEDLGTRKQQLEVRLSHRLVWQQLLTCVQLRNSPTYHDGLLLDIRMFHEISAKTNFLPSLLDRYYGAKPNWLVM